MKQHHATADTDQHMRLMLLQVDKRLVELGQEMGFQENLNRQLRQLQRELEENLEEREDRLAQAHETINSLEREKQNLLKLLQEMKDKNETENRKRENNMSTCPHSSQSCSEDKAKAGVSSPDPADARPSTSSSTVTDTYGSTKGSLAPTPPKMASLSVRLVDCRDKLGPDGCVNVAQHGHLFG